MGEPNLGGAGTFECDGLCVVVCHCLVSRSCIEWPAKPSSRSAFHGPILQKSGSLTNIYLPLLIFTSPGTKRCSDRKSQFQTLENTSSWSTAD
jgi:hypothetical protein